MGANGRASQAKTAAVELALLACANGQGMIPEHRGPCDQHLRDLVFPRERSREGISRVDNIHDARSSILIEAVQPFIGGLHRSSLDQPIFICYDKEEHVLYRRLRGVDHGLDLWPW